MVWRDIDLGVISETLDENKYWEMVQFLYHLNNYYHSLYIPGFFEKALIQRLLKDYLLGLK